MNATIQDNLAGASAVATGSSTITDSLLSTSFAGPTVAAGTTTVSGLVANLSDFIPDDTLANLSATITWGDGTSSPGTIAVNPSGGYTISGTKTYKGPGSFGVGVTVTSSGDTSVTGTASGTVVVPQTITASPASIAGTVGTSISGVKLASFTALGTGGAANFAASITWGDNTTGAGTIQADPAGGFDVLGTHTFAKAGTFPVSVAIRDTVAGGSATASVSAAIADAALSATFASPTVASGTTSVSGVIATVAYANPSATAANLSATIVWGDGTSSPGTIAASPTGGFLVSGTKTYGGPGTFAVGVAVTTSAGGTASTSGTVVVADRPPVLPDVPTQVVNEGSTLALNIGASDPDAGQTLSYALGAGAPAGSAIDAITGRFTWTPTAGPLAVDVPVIVTDSASPALSTTKTFHVVVNDVAPLVLSGGNATLTQGGTFSEAGRFTDPGAQTWTATVNYGDGSGAQPLTLNPDKTFALSHTYTATGTFSVTVAVTDSGGQTGSSVSGVKVSSAPPVELTSAATVPGKKKSIAAITLTFNGPIDASIASDLSHYRLGTAGRDRKFNTKDDRLVTFASATYDPATNTVRLVPKKRLVATSGLQFRVTGLKDRLGNLVDGNMDGTAGGDYVANLTKKGLATVYTPSGA